MENRGEEQGTMEKIEEERRRRMGRKRRKEKNNLVRCENRGEEEPRWGGSREGGTVSLEG